MARIPSSQTIIVRHERTNLFRSAVVDNVSTSLFSDKFYDRISLFFGRGEKRIVSERAVQSPSGEISFKPDSIESLFVRNVEFEAIMTPHQAVDMMRVVTSALKNIPRDRRESLGIDTITHALMQVFDL